MSKRSLLLTIFSIMLMLPACIKDELTLPAKVFFEFELIPSFDTPPGGMIINKGSIIIESIEFDGRRDQGKDVYFTSDLSGPVFIDLENGQSDRELSFDIPQGVYNRVKIILNLAEKMEGSKGIPFVLEGKISEGPMNNMNKIPLRFEYNFHERIEIEARSGNNANKIVLRKDTPATARIVVDAGLLFQFVNLPTLNNFTISQFNNQETIIISPESNSEIFNRIGQNRGLERSFRVIVD